MNSKSVQVIAGLDVGTSKVRAVICELFPSGKMEIIGVGQSASLGIKKGMVSNIEQTVASIRSAVEEAEKMAGRKISSVFVGITGAHVKSQNSSGVITIKDDEIVAEDISRVIEAAQSVSIGADEKIIHVMPQSYMVDDVDGISDPIGMSASRLESKVHVIAGKAGTIQNLLKCINQCDLEVESIILNQIATSKAVLSDDEKELGVCLLDIGEGTTDIAVFHEGAIRHSSVIPIAGAQVTRDIAITMRTSSQIAEKLKRRYSNAFSSSVGESEAVEVAETTDRPARTISHRRLAEVVEPRMEELFQYIRSALELGGHMDAIGSGIVIAGGGARMNGILTLAEAIFGTPARAGTPQYGSTLSEVVHHPSFATVVGLCQIGLESCAIAEQVEQHDEEECSSYRPGLLDYLRNFGRHSDISDAALERAGARGGP